MRTMTRERWMALAFALGSLCFVVGPIGIYARLVGNEADAVTYFAGSIPFTIGGGLQTLIAWRDRHCADAGVALVSSAVVQSIGTVYFNLTTGRSLFLDPASAHYDELVWRPDAFGSLAFLVSGVIAYLASPRRGLRPIVDGPGWWQPSINLLGCVLFGVSAIAGYSASRGSLIGPGVSDWNTALGAVCFLWCAVATLVGGDTFKSPRLRRWEREIEIDVEATIGLR